MRTGVVLLAACVLSPAQILTPKPSAKPRINGPAVYGVRPGRPLLYRIPASGERPMQFSASGLPKGVVLDGHTGVITGRIADRGEYRVTLRAKNRAGATQRTFKIAVGDALALTPPMGWSSWYCARGNISDAYIRAQADAMVSSGLADHGYSYVNIDDCWNVQPGSPDPLLGGEPRDSKGNLRPNRNFPDMKALTDYVHSKGLKIGIYSSPGPLTCGKFAGSLGHEQQDARQFAAWGFDLLKYDWCSYADRKTVKNAEEWQRPYRQMSAMLQPLDRDILLNICQYGYGDVSKWGKAVGGHFWRTGDDLGVASKGLWTNILRFGFSLAGTEANAGPGGWNDPDNIMIGQLILTIPPKRTPIGPVPLTPDEQYSHVTLWALVASPMIFGGDMTKLDDFTISLLTNDEMLDVNQDVLGKQAALVSKEGDVQVWAKDLADGSKAVGLFNLSEGKAEVRARWSSLSLKGPRKVRDLWRRRDLGTFDGEFKAEVERHGVVLIKVAGPRQAK